MSGLYEGMLQSRRFTVVAPNGTVKTVDYSGNPVKVKLWEAANPEKFCEKHVTCFSQKFF